jgi:thiamine biosynthesis lipoprotein
MGTEYHVLIAAEDFSEGARQEADRALRSALTEVDDLMTTYRESEVTRFNAWRETTPFAVSQPTARVVDLALRLAQETDGALDITVAPLVRALGFGPDAVTSPPSLERLTTFRQRIGSHLLRLEDQRLTKLDPRLEIDLSALAKGYAVDRAAEALDRLGLTDYMIEVGGEVRARGFNDRGERWRIGVERPPRI